MSNSYVTVETDSGVAVVTLNRPERRNAFDDTVVDELTRAFRSLERDAHVRAIVLRGAGKAFSAGADLDWMRRMAEYSRDENLADAARTQSMFEAVDTCSKVVIAAVHGAAMGGGAGLVACCDIALAAPDTVFAFSEVRLGIAPSIIAPYVVRRIGPGAARALFVTGRRFDAAEALRIGLVHQVTPADDLDDAVRAAIDDVLQTGPNAVTAIKHLLRDIADTAEPEHVRQITIELIASLRASQEGQEGLRAFLEKRPPNF